MSDAPVLQVEGLVKHFPIHGGLLQRQVGAVKAVDGVTFSIRRGETLGLVGESGCGKSTTGRLVLRLIEATEGTIRFAGRDVRGLGRGALLPGVLEHRVDDAGGDGRGAAGDRSRRCGGSRRSGGRGLVFFFDFFSGKRRRRRSWSGVGGNYHG